MLVRPFLTSHWMNKYYEHTNSGNNRTILNKKADAVYQHQLWWRSGNSVWERYLLSRGATVQLVHSRTRTLIWFRGSSVMSIKENKVWVQDAYLFCKVTVWKGREASGEQLLGYHRVSPVTSQIDLILRWKRMRMPHSRFIGTTTDTVEWEQGSLTKSMTTVFTQLGISAPPDGKYTSYSIRIGAHSEQVMLGIPLEARKTRFWWGPNSSATPNMYFDRKFSSSAASHWFFGTPPRIAGPATISSSAAT